MVMLATAVSPGLHACQSVTRCFLHVTRPLPFSRQLHASTVVREANDSLLTKVKSELKTSMRAKDSFASTVIRSLLSEHQYAVKAQQGSSDGNDNALLSNLIQKALARRQESARQFRAASPAREDLAEKEDREAQLIKGFLPEQISSQELESIVQRVISDVKAAGFEEKRMMGEVMKGLKGQVDKARAPGAMISDTVKKLLAK